MFSLQVTEVKSPTCSIRAGFILVLSLALQLALNQSTLHAQTVTFSGTPGAVTQTTVSVTGSIDPGGGVSVDTAGNVYFFNSATYTILEIPAGGGLRSRWRITCRTLGWGLIPLAQAVARSYS
ncbi:MAG: hypothetical protein ABSG62_19430 [Terracidiphilus sp.]|jgi:hypothetical protein